MIQSIISFLSSSGNIAILLNNDPLKHWAKPSQHQNLLGAGQIHRFSAALLQEKKKETSKGEGLRGKKQDILFLKIYLF